MATLCSEAVVRRCSVKKVFLQILQNSQENTCARASFLIKLLAPATLLRKKLWHRCFPVNSAKFVRTPFFIEHLRRLLLYVRCTLLLLGASRAFNFLQNRNRNCKPHKIKFKCVWWPSCCRLLRVFIVFS